MARSVRRLLLVLAVTGCGRERAPAQDSAGAAAIAASPTTARAAGPACTRTGHWVACAVQTRLEQSGLAPLKADKIDALPKVGPTPLLYRVGNAELAIFIFADTLARHRAAAALDTAAYIAPSRDLSMRNETTAIQNDNLLGLLYSRNEHQRERVADALTAGPPQP